MTKEELYSKMDFSGQYKSDDEKLLDEFFDSNVCIPKGANRHEFADVLHELFEDMDKKGEVSYIGTSLGWSGFDSYRDYKFRIKPSEAIYEYIWYNADGDTKWMTLDEAKEFERPWFWAKETGRMRQ